MNPLAGETVDGGIGNAPPPIVITLRSASPVCTSVTVSRRDGVFMEMPPIDVTLSRLSLTATVEDD